MERLDEQFPELASALRGLDDGGCWTAAARVVDAALGATDTVVADSATPLELRLAADAFAMRGSARDLPRASLSLAASIARQGGPRGSAYECIRHAALALRGREDVILRAIVGEP